jgi:hypothetical protein
MKLHLFTLKEQHRDRKNLGAGENYIIGRFIICTRHKILSQKRSQRMKWAEDVAHMAKMRHAYKILVRKSKGKRSLRRPMHRWEDNIKIDFNEIGCTRWYREVPRLLLL